LPGVGPERLHASLAIFSESGIIDLEIKSSFMNDSEKRFLLIQTEAAEHAPRFDIVQFLQLIEYEIFERLVFRIHHASKGWVQLGSISCAEPRRRDNNLLIPSIHAGGKRLVQSSQLSLYRVPQTNGQLARFELTLNHEELEP
jgi:hypothetical protein